MHPEAELDITDVTFLISYDDDAYQTIWQAYIRRKVDIWVVQYMPLLTSLCRKACRKWSLHNHEEDMINDCVIEAYRYAKNYKPMDGASFNAYMQAYFKLYPGRHDVIARYRKGMAYGESEYEHITDTVVAREEIFTSDEYRSASELLESLPPLDRTYLVLKYVSGMSNTAIGQAIGVSECVVRYQLKRILGKVRIRGDGL